MDSRGVPLARRDDRRMTLMTREGGTDKMRVSHFVITVLVVAGLSSTARAQSPSSAQPVTQPATAYSEPADHWFASAYLGSNFGSGGSSNLENLANLDIDNGSTASINFGGEF